MYLKIQDLFEINRISLKFISLKLLLIKKVLSYLNINYHVPEILPEIIEGGPLCITDLFQNKYVAYYKSIFIFLSIFKIFV
jgi:hypothetical protein